MPPVPKKRIFSVQKKVRKLKTNNSDSSMGKFTIEEIGPIHVPGELVHAPQITSSSLLPEYLPLTERRQTPSELSNSTNMSNSNYTSSNRINPSNHFSSPVPSLDTNSNPDVTYLSVKLAAELVPRFDGKLSDLTHFLKQCKKATSKVKEADKDHLLSLIQNKIVGHALQLLANRKDPENLEELIQNLRNVFARDFNVGRVYKELQSLRQAENETAEFYGARVSAILSRGLEAAKEKFDSPDAGGARKMLTNAAIMGFARGLRKTSFGEMIVKDEPDSLDIAIDIAARLEREYPQEIIESPPQSRTIVREARTFVGYGVDSRLCFNCQKIGHISTRCPEPPRPTCEWCQKRGHQEAVCRFKLNGYPRTFSPRNPQPQVPRTPHTANLNSRGGPQVGATPVRPLFARAATTESVTNPE